MVTAAVAYLCLHGLDEAGAWRWLCLAALVCVAAKIGAEMALGPSFALAVEAGSFVPVPESHVVGAATALVLFPWAKRVGARRTTAV